MRKYMVMFMMLLATVFFAQAEVTRQQIVTARETGSIQTVLALVPSCANATQRSIVYRTAIEMTPKAQKVAFAQTIPTNSITAPLRLTIAIMVEPKGTNCNAMIIQYYSQKRLNTIGPWDKFDTSVASREETIQLYELMQQNVEPNDETTAGLSRAMSKLSLMRY